MRMSSCQTSNKRIHLTKNSYAFFTGDFNRYMPKNKIIPLKLALPEYIFIEIFRLQGIPWEKWQGE